MQLEYSQLGRQTGDDLMIALANLRQVKRGLMDDLLTGRVRVVWTTKHAKGTKHAKARRLSWPSCFEVRRGLSD